MGLQPADIHDFYERSYTDGDEEWFRRWRELGARVKADHVSELLDQIEPPATVLEVGCGEGAVLSELARRGVGAKRTGIEISSSAIELAAQRPEIDEARVFDGAHIDAADGAFDLAICTHVLEHLFEPLPLLVEIERVARAVVIEVPLEHNLSARRPAARALSEKSGHLQRFDRAAIRRLVTTTGWQVQKELLDPLPLAVHTFGAVGARQRAKGSAKWAVRSALAAVPPVGERLMTMHYTLLALPAGGSRRGGGPS